MAGKKTKKDGVDELDFGDLDDLDMDEVNFDDSSLDDPDRAPSRSEVAKDMAKQAGTGFVESMAKKTAEKALPPEYASNYSDVMDLAGFATDVVDRNKQQLDKSMFKLGKEVKKLLPMQIGLLDKYLAKKEEEFAEFKQQSEEEMRNASISSELSSIFDQQLDIQKALEAKRSAEDRVETKERLIATKLNLDVLRSIDASVATSAAFETQISKQFFRKSLELQYKSFFVQADMLRTMRDSYKGFTLLLTNIEKNSGLPDYVKLKNTERLADIARTNATQAVYSQLFSRNKYIQTVKDRLGRAVNDKVTSITDSMGDITDALSMMNDGGKGAGLRALGGIAAGMGGDTLGEMAGSRLGGKLQERLKDNKYVNTGANYLKAFAASPATLMRSLRDKAAEREQEAEGRGSWSSKLYGMARAGLDLTAEDRPNIGVKRDNYLDHNQPAIFDNKVHRSITEAIPMLLSRILQKNSDMNQMYYQANQHIVSPPNSPLLMYDYQGRKLDSGESIKAKLQDSVFSQRSTKNRTTAIASNTLTKSKANISRNTAMTKDQKKQLNATLNAKGAQDALAEYYARASSIKGINLDHDTLIVNAGKNKDLAALINANPQLAKVIDVLRQNSDKDNSYIDQSLADIQNPYPIEAIKNLFTDSSKLTSAKQPNLVTDKNANAISKALSRFILNRGEDITANNILSRLAFSYFRPDEFNEQVKQNIAVLIDDVKRITSHGDIVLQSSLMALLALVNQSLKSNFEIDPAVFGNIRELYPDFVKQSRLTIENLAEGKIDAGVDEYMNFMDIKDATKVSSREVGLIREQVFATSGVDRILSRVKSKGEEFKKGLTAASGSPTAMAEFLLQQAKSFKSTVAASLTKTSNEIQQGFTKLGNHVDTLVKEGSAKALGLMVQELTALDQKLENYIVLTQNDLAQRTEELQNAKDSVVEVTTQTKLQRAATRELELFVRMGEKNLKALVKLRETVQRNTQSIRQMAQNPTTPPTEALRKMGTAIRDVLDQAKKQLAELEAAGASERAAAAAA